MSEMIPQVDDVPEDDWAEPIDLGIDHDEDEEES